MRDFQSPSNAEIIQSGTGKIEQQAHADFGRKTVFWVFLLMCSALVFSAVVNLQLYADGSAYLFNIILYKGPSIWHGRLGNHLFHAPAVWFTRLSENLIAAKLIFCLTYASIPFFSLLLSFWVLRRNRRLFIWPSLIILMANLVNMSWVSEFCLVIQLFCPVFFAAVIDPKGLEFKTLLVLIGPLIYTLHPMVSLFFIFMGVILICCYKKDLYIIAISFILIAISLIKSLYKIFNIESYERKFIDINKIINYIFDSSYEMILLLVIVLFIGIYYLVKCENIKNLSTKIYLIFFILFELIILYFINFNIKYNLIVINIIFIILNIFFIYIGIRKIKSETAGPMTLCMVWLCVSAGLMLLSQYANHGYNLKTGLILIVAQAVMVMALIDHRRIDSGTSELVGRSHLVVVMAVVFFLVIIGKSLIWAKAVSNLQTALRNQTELCMEADSEAYRWLKEFPNGILKTWRIGRTSLLVQNEPPRKLLLKKRGLCKRSRLNNRIYFSKRNGREFTKVDRVFNLTGRLNTD
ncbi:MAG: hypothetical protein JRK53_17990 [Deltaproteobacteria bacterium]|nr:hypothetical protein [Deltaproteobacteria bacterium]